MQCFTVLFLDIMYCKKKKKKSNTRSDSRPFHCSHGSYSLSVWLADSSQPLECLSQTNQVDTRYQLSAFEAGLVVLEEVTEKKRDVKTSIYFYEEAKMLHRIPRRHMETSPTVKTLHRQITAWAAPSLDHSIRTQTVKM